MNLEKKIYVICTLSEEHDWLSEGNYMALWNPVSPYEVAFCPLSFNEGRQPTTSYSF